MGKDWKVSKAEQEILAYEREQIVKWKKENPSKVVATPPRSYEDELRTIGLTHDQCSAVLEWINTLSIHITGNNHTVNIEDGIIKVSNTED
jgi:hypothetical protein